MFIPVDVWFRAFLLTVIVEVPIVGLALRSRAASWPRLIVLIVFANLASHPAVWFIFTQLLVLDTPAYLAVAEGWAIAVEALFYWTTFRGLPVRQAVVISLVANGASFVVGRIAVALWPDLSG